MPRTYHAGPVEPLTARQREVLELIDQGYTNPEIATRLGITIDGAKWHVREILSKFGVESREEAVQTWRQQRGLTQRLRGMGQTLAGISMTRIALVAGGVLGASVAGAFAVLVVLNRGSGGAPAASDSPMQAVETATPTATIVVETPSPVVATTFAESIDGVEIQRLQDVGEVRLPSGLVVYHGIRRENADGYPRSLHRAYRDSTGKLWREDLLGSLQPYGYVADLVSDLSVGRIFAIVCTQGDCGLIGMPQDDPQWRAFESLDGGVSWEDRGLLPWNTWVEGVIGTDLLMKSLEGEDLENPRPRYWLFASGTDVPVPAGLPVSAYPVVEPNLGLTWSDGRGNVFDSAGEPILPGAGRELVRSRDGSNVLSWLEQLATGENRVVLGRLAPNGSFSAIYDVRTVTYPSVAIENRWILGFTTSYLAQGELHPAIDVFDLDAGTYGILTELIDGYDNMVGPTIHDAFQKRDGFARVVIPGDCLNIREEPRLDGMLIGCAADGVLLDRTGTSRSADNVEWIEVITPDGKTKGWASSPYLAW